MSRYRITITSNDRQAMLALVRKTGLEVFDHGARYSAATGYSVDGIAAPPVIHDLRSGGYHVRQHEDADERGKARQREVATGNRYTDTDTDADPDRAQR
jgi:hypothetical protein